MRFLDDFYRGKECNSNNCLNHSFFLIFHEAPYNIDYWLNLESFDTPTTLTDSFASSLVLPSLLPLLCQMTIFTYIFAIWAHPSPFCTALIFQLQGSSLVTALSLSSSRCYFYYLLQVFPIFCHYFRHLIIFIFCLHFIKYQQFQHYQYLDEQFS